MKSLNKARDVLCLISAEPEIGLSALARSLELPKSTAYRILRALESAGLVSQLDGGHKYVLGSLVFELASGHASRPRLIELARPYMVQLRDQCHETVALHVPHGNAWVAISQVESTQELRRTLTNIGLPMPLYAGAAGKLFLAHMPAAERDAYLADTALVQLAPGTITNRRRLLEELALIRRRGYSTSFQEAVMGIAGIVMPIKSADGTIRGAMGVSGPMSRFSSRSVSAIRLTLEKAVTELSRRMRKHMPVDARNEALAERPPVAAQRSFQNR